MRSWAAFGVAVWIAGCGGDRPAPRRARVTHLAIPEDAFQARALGCVSEGRTVGSAMGSLAVLSGGFDPALADRENAPARFHFELTTSESQQGLWLTGQRLNARGSVRARFDSRLGPVQYSGEGWFEGPLTWVVPLPVLDDHELELTAERAYAFGRLAEDRNGSRYAEELVVSAYVGLESLQVALQRLDRACDQSRPPQVCGVFRQQVMPKGDSLEAALPRLLTFVGGLDTSLSAAGERACDSAEPECNAISLCMRLAASPVEP